MNAVRSRYILVCALVIVVLMMTAGGVLSSGMMMQDGTMVNCPYMGIASLCKMDVFQHLSAWQQMFVSTVPPFAVFVVLVLIALLLSHFFEDFLAYKPPSAKPLLYHRHSCEIFDPLKLAFSRGLIHPKIF